MRAVAFILAAVLPLHVAAQEAELICISVGDAEVSTVLIMYGVSGGTVAMQIAPDGPDTGPDAMTDASVIRHGPEVFAALAEILVPALETPPTAPGAEACAEDTLGPVAMGIAFTDGTANVFEALCPTPEILDLNLAMITATGDPLGQEVTSWRAQAIPAHRDMCRNLP